MTSDDDADLEEPVTPPPGKSPPGMGLRSGKKKRRRSRETTGLTPPDEVAKKRKRSEGEDDSKVDDAEMEEAESQEESEDDVSEEVASSASTSKVAAAQAKTRAPVEKPSRPKKTDTTTPASEELERILERPPMLQPSQPTPTGRHDALPRNLVRTASDILVTFTTSVQEVSTNLIVPQPERLQVQEEEETNVEDDEQPLFSLPLENMWFWVVVLLVGQLVCSLGIPFGINPIGSIASSSTNALSSIYQGILGDPLEATKEPIDIDSKEYVFDEAEIVFETPEPKEDPLVPVLNLLHSSLETLHDNKTALEKEVKKAEDAVDERKKSLEALREALQKAHDNVLEVLDAIVDDKTPDLKKAQSSLQELESLSGLSFPVLNDDTIPLWEEPSSGCQASSPASQDAVLKSDTLKRNVQDLRNMEKASAKALKQDVDGIQSWISRHVKEAMATLYSNHATTEKQPIESGLAIDRVQAVIEQRLEKEIADQTGLFDYASLRSGASIIKSGPRATSPSLVDNLPLLNRAMAWMRLRFYGHGPEASLLPTYPTDALGQCWSFQSANPNPKDILGGDFGTLSVKLSGPVSVTSVVVEHAPKEVTRNAGSAIREFRVYGYESTDATGRAFDLGTFKYDIDHERALQTFETKTTARNGSEIPKVASVTLAIDSNYGMEYACLYRFRVHGEP